MGSRGVFTARGTLMVCLVLALCSFRSAEGHWGPWGPWNGWWRTNSVVSVVNDVQQPTFNISVAVPWRRAPALDFLEAAATLDQRFRFSATYFNSTLGYFIDAINGLRGDFAANRTWWLFTNATGIPHNLGVSNYYPRFGEPVHFIFTQSP